ncbi:MAG: hypothetical protein Q9217_004350 [Psora testacea]
MKVLAGFLWASIAATVYAASNVAIVYLSNNEPSGSSSTPPSISPKTARLLLAQRLGLSQYHDLGDADDLTLEILNRHGGIRHKVFVPQDESSVKRQLLLVVEGVEHPEDIIDGELSPAMTMSNPPPGSTTQQLVLDLLEQDNHQRGRQSELCSFRFPRGSAVLSGGVNGLPMTQQQCCQLQKTISLLDKKAPLSSLAEVYDLPLLIGLGYTSTFYDFAPKDGKHYKSALADVKSLIQRTRDHNVDSTILLIPPSSRTTIRSSFGTYTMPHLHKRQQPQPEEVLSTDLTPSTSLSPSPPETLQTTTLPRGILPVCHPNLESAISATNNCSGHGTAYKKSSGAIDCYACRCSSTKLTDSDGKSKTVHWGGPACQKKDVSMQFFLLAGLTIGLIAVVAWGIGLLVSIGQEDLPSVIGAGVAGPRAQK